MPPDEKRRSRHVDSRNSARRIARGRGALPPLRHVWIYEQYKENLQRESFCLRALLRCIKLFVPSRRLPDAPPFHFIKF